MYLLYKINDTSFVNKTQTWQGSYFLLAQGSLHIMNHFALTFNHQKSPFMLTLLLSFHLASF